MLAPLPDILCLQHVLVLPLRRDSIIGISDMGHGDGPRRQDGNDGALGEEPRSHA